MMDGTDELDRLRVNGAGTPGAQLHEVAEFSSADPRKVLTRSAEVMTAVVQGTRSMPEWSSADWRAALPSWFVEACAPEQTSSERQAWLERWRAQDRAGKLHMEEELGWSLTDWIAAMAPDSRAWLWWSSDVISDERGIVSVIVSGWPAPLESLEWLLQASGASSIVLGATPA